MPTRGGTPYLREEVSESNTDSMASQPSLTDIMSKLDFLTQEANAFRLDANWLKENVNRVVTKLETHNQNPKSSTCVIPIVKKVVDKPYSTIPLIFTPVVKEFSEVSKEFQDKPSPIYDNQPEIESDFKEFTYHPDIDSDEDVDDDFADDQVHVELGDDIVESSTLISDEVIPVIMKLVDIFLKDVTYNDISQTLSSHLSIISIALSQKGYKNCKVIVDNWSCTNVVFFELFENDGLKLLPYSHPVKVLWFKSTFIKVTQPWLVPIDFHLYFERTVVYVKNQV